MVDPVVEATVALSHGATAAILDLLGGRLTTLAVDGLELLVSNGPDQFHFGSFPMAPWAGRLRHGRLQFDGRVVDVPRNSPPHALHGLVTDRVWTVLTVDQRSVTLVIDLGREAWDPWPWPCSVVQAVSLEEDGADFVLEVHADEPMPAHVGWHPWFRRRLGPGAAELAQLYVGSGQVYLNGPDGLPSGEMSAPPPPPWDYCFVGLTEPPVVRWPGALELTVDSDCDHWVLYDADPAGICVEPWTGPPNCLNGPRPRIVTPDNPLRAWMSWRWRPLAG